MERPGGYISLEKLETLSRYVSIAGMHPTQTHRPWFSLCAGFVRWVVNVPPVTTTPLALLNIELGLSSKGS
jgi:hypothetical protein